MANNKITQQQVVQQRAIPQTDKHFAQSQGEKVIQQKATQPINNPFVKGSTPTQRKTLGKAEAENSLAETSAKNAPIQAKAENKTGMSDDLKSGIESLSGVDMSDVKVHYNSDKPAQLQAHAYAQGSDIHLASGQEKHLPHEAWHVVQQKQGRVQPTTQLKGTNVNDDSSLEREADVMGARAIQMKSAKPTAQLRYNPSSPRSIVQRYAQEGTRKVSKNRKYIVDDVKRTLLYAKKDAAPPQPLDFFDKKSSEGDYDVYESKADIKEYKPERKLPELVPTNVPDRYNVRDAEEVTFSKKKGAFWGENDCGGYANALSTKRTEWTEGGLVQVVIPSTGEHYYMKSPVAGTANLGDFYDTSKENTRIGTHGFDAKGFDRDLTDRGYAANPNLGEAYFIYPPEGAENVRNRINKADKTNYHVATVVAKDGEDNITNEANADDKRAVPYFEMYGTIDTKEKRDQTFLGRYWQNYTTDGKTEPDARVARLSPTPYIAPKPITPLGMKPLSAKTPPVPSITLPPITAPKEKKK